MFDASAKVKTSGRKNHPPISPLHPIFNIIDTICTKRNKLYLHEKLTPKMPPPGQLSNTILHHPGTFDSCLEVDIADDYQDHQIDQDHQDDDPMASMQLQLRSNLQF